MLTGSEPVSIFSLSRFAAEQQEKRGAKKMVWLCLSFKNLALGKGGGNFNDI